MRSRIRGWGAMSVLCLSLLSACGGGGGDAPASTPAAPTNPNPNPVASTNSFALAAGYRARLIAGSNDNFDITGSCSGTANITLSPTTPASFEGVSGFGAGQVSTATLTNCAPTTSSSTGTTYYNANHSPVGLTVNGGEYAVFTAAPVNLAASARVGDRDTIVTYNVYNNSSKATLIGTRVVSYAIEPDTTTTAIANIVTKSYNTSNALLSTQQSRYKMAADGSLTLLTIEVQFDTTSVLRLVYTKK